MSSRLRWMPNWLTGPSLGKYMKVRPGNSQHSDVENKNLDSTKQMLKKHMVDTFFERALHQIDPETEGESTPVAQVLPAEKEPGDAAHTTQPVAIEDEKVDAADVSIPDEVFLIDEDDGDLLAEAATTAFGGSVEEVPVGYYVFAITLSQAEIQLPTEGIYDEYPLFVYGFGNAQAIISEVPLEIYSETALQARLNDAAWFERALRTHNKILGQIQAQASIVPMRVCTICDTIDGLKSFLDEHHDDFVSTLVLIEGNQSWRFNIYCNEPRLRSLTAKASNRVRAIQAEIAGKSKVEAQPLLVRLEAVLEEEARSVCKACVKHSHGTLTTISSKNLIHSLTEAQAGETIKREIFRCDYLVSNVQKEAFQHELKGLIVAYRSLGFELGIQGPYPPAQFAGRKVLPAEKPQQHMMRMNLGETASGG